LEVSYVDSVGVKLADRADACQRLPISVNSTLIVTAQVPPGKKTVDAGIVA